MTKTENTYEKALRKDMNIKLLTSFLEHTQMTSGNIFQGIIQLNNILLGAAKKSCFVKRSKVQRKHKIHQTQDWFTKECRGRRNIMRRYSKDLSTNQPL